MNIKRTVSVSPNQKSNIVQKETLESENVVPSKAGDLSENEKNDDFK